MDVVLTRPFYKAHLITPPLGLGYLAAYARQAGHQAKMVDGLLLRLEPDRLATRCDAPVVGISCLTAYMPEVTELVAALKRRGHITILGGPHVTALPHESLAETGADYAVVGEGEISLVELLDRLERGETGEDLPGVLTAGAPSFVPRPFVADLDTLPLPDWDQMPPTAYPLAPHGGLIKYFPVAPIISSRGCAHACSFCASPTLWGRRVRFRSADNVIAEIRLLIEKFGVREIHFEDDNLTLRRSHVVALCERLLSEFERPVTWALPNGVRVDTITPDLAALMKRAGCYMLAFGVESGNQYILDRVNKRVRLETIRQAIEIASRAGMLTQGFFIFGLPGETAESITRTIEFAARSRLDRAQFLTLDVLPGSQLWTELRDALPQRRRRSFCEITWQPPTVDAATLASAQPRAFRRFFLRSPRRLLRLIRLFKPQQTRFVLRRLYDFRIFGRLGRPRGSVKENRGETTRGPVTEADLLEMQAQCTSSSWKGIPW